VRKPGRIDDQTRGDDQPGIGEQKKDAVAPASPEEPPVSAVSAAAEEPSHIQRVSPEPAKKRGSRSGWKWAFPLGIGLAGLASAAAVLLRGCWHSNMSWPARVSDEHGDFSYQTCNDCGIMRLFDERVFRGYGPYGYDLHALIAHERLQRRQRMQRAAERERLARKAAPPKSP
jgi:hypothetical protein